MKYDTCRRCPRNKKCELMFRAEQGKKKQNKQVDKKG